MNTIVKALAGLNVMRKVWDTVNRKATIADNGNIINQNGRKIGHYNRKTGVGTLSFFGYQSLLKDKDIQ